MSFHLFKYCFMFLNKFLQHFQCISLAKCILSYFILLDARNEIVFLISFSRCSLMMQRKTELLILQLVTLLNLFINSSGFFVGLLRFSICTIMTSALEIVLISCGLGLQWLKAGFWFLARDWCQVMGVRTPNPNLTRPVAGLVTRP